VLIERDGFVAQLADEQVLLLDFFFKGERAVELFLGGSDGCLCGGGGVGGELDLFAEVVELGFVGFDGLFEFLSSYCALLAW
jgi:hypothetical protein